MRDWRADLVTDLGGEDGLSTQEKSLVDVVTRTKVMLDQIDLWLLHQPRLVTKRKGLNPVVLQRVLLVQSLRQLLDALGLKRRAKDTQTLEAYLASKGTNGSSNGPTAAEPANSDHGGCRSRTERTTAARRRPFSYRRSIPKAKPSSTRAA